MNYSQVPYWRVKIKLYVHYRHEQTQRSGNPWTCIIRGIGIHVRSLRRRSTLKNQSWNSRSWHPFQCEIHHPFGRSVFNCIWRNAIIVFPVLNTQVTGLYLLYPWGLFRGMKKESVHIPIVESTLGEWLRLQMPILLLQQLSFLSHPWTMCHL